MSFASSGSRPSDKTTLESEASNVFIKKPRTLSKTCPVEITTQRLPFIREKPHRKREVRKTKESSSDTEAYWLKPGISLPKLPPKKVSQSVYPREEEIRDSLGSVEFNSVIGLKGVGADSGELHQQSLSKILTCYKKVQQAESDNADAVGPSQCQNVFKVRSSELNFDEFNVEDEKLEESHALRRWEYWLEQHKHLQQYLSKKLKRRKEELQFQKAQDYRTVVEDRSLLLLAQLPEADKWRGHPFQWKPAHKIGGAKTKIVFDDYYPEYYGVKTKLERGEIPNIEFIGIPKVVKEEKGLLPQHSRGGLNLGWENLPYRRNRLQDLKLQTKKIKPHEIQMDELQVVGKKICQGPKQEKVIPVPSEKLPKIVVTDIEDFCSSSAYPKHSSMFWLSIGGEDLRYEIGNENCQKIKKVKDDLRWEIGFGVHPVGVLVEKTLEVENKGTMAVEYNFILHKNKAENLLNSVQPARHEPWFFFNKNSGIFLPGQKYELKFYNYAKRSGVRKETWHLTTKPPLTRNEDSGTIVLWAVTTDDASDSDINALDLYLKKRVTLSIVDFILRILFAKVLNPLENLHDIEYRSLFLEKTLFEYQNPKYFYHSVIVRKLQQVFNQIPDKKQEEWDLSLSSLIELIKIHVNIKDQDLLFRQITENAKKLLRPNYLLVKDIKKYRMTYEILCNMINFIEEDYNYLKNCCFERKEPSRKCSSDFGEMDEECNFSRTISEEKAGEELIIKAAEVRLEIKPMNFLFFQNLLYLKVYHRLREAVECIVGALETSKLLEPWKKRDLGFTRPCQGYKK